MLYRKLKTKRYGRSLEDDGKYRALSHIDAKYLQTGNEHISLVPFNTMPPQNITRGDFLLVRTSLNSDAVSPPLSLNPACSTIKKSGFYHNHALLTVLLHTSSHRYILPLGQSDSCQTHPWSYPPLPSCQTYPSRPAFTPGYYGQCRPLYSTATPLPPLQHPAATGSTARFPPASHENGAHCWRMHMETEVQMRCHCGRVCRGMRNSSGAGCVRLPTRLSIRSIFSLGQFYFIPFTSLTLPFRANPFSNIGCAGCAAAAGSYCRKCFRDDADVANFCRETRGMAEEKCAVEFCKGVK